METEYTQAQIENWLADERARYAEEMAADADYMRGLAEIGKTIEEWMGNGAYKV